MGKLVHQLTTSLRIEVGTLVHHLTTSLRIEVGTLIHQLTPHKGRRIEAGTITSPADVVITRPQVGVGARSIKLKK